MKRWLLPIFVGLAVGWPIAGDAASLGFSPSSQRLQVGDKISVAVRVNAGGQAINSAEGTITYPTSLLTLTGVSKSGIFTFWALEPSSANDGSVSFIGGLPNPGYSGTSGTIIRLSFTVRAAGTATLRFSGAKVLANDGQGTNVLAGQGIATLTLTERSSPGTTPPPPSIPTRPTPTLSSPEYPDQNIWSNKKTATLHWTRPAGLLGVSVVTDTAANTVPDEVADGVSSPLALTFTEDGVTYVHLRGRYASGWSNTATYAFRYDGSAPESLAVTVEQDRGASDPTPTAVFSATDPASGIASYTVQLDDGPPLPATSPFQLAAVLGGAHTVIVTAVDRAGNSRTAAASFSVTGYPAPVIHSLTSPIMLLENFTVAGTAAAGDVVIILLDDHPIGQVTVGQVPSDNPNNIYVQAPWSYTSEQIVGPGRHSVTAKSIGPEGQQSVATDPARLFVVGNTVYFRGRPMAVVAFAPLAAILVLILLVLNTYIYWRLTASARRLWRREVTAEEEIEDLRQRVHRDRLTAVELDTKLRAIELDLEGQRPVARTRRRRAGRRE